MLVAIDESGCTGFKNGSSRYFLMTLVVFDAEADGRYEDAEQTASAIEAIRLQANHKSEFHFSKCSHKMRRQFFRGINDYKCCFEVYALVIDKPKVYSPTLRGNTKNFYNFVLKQLLSKNPIVNANIKIDGEKSKVFKKQLTSYLRRGQNGMVSKLKFVNSKNDALIQLADMCCSAIAYSYNHSEKIGASEYKDLLGGRIKNIWEFK